MADGSTPHSGAVFDEFKTQLEKCTLEGVCGRKYIRVQKLTNWLKSEVTTTTGRKDATRLHMLLNHAYRNLPGPGYPIDPSVICAQGSTCLCVFSILLELDCGNLVYHFNKVDITDNALPIRLRTLKRKVNELESNGTAVQVQTLAQQFYQRQWAYCPAIFELNMGKIFPHNRVMPLCKKEQINDKGGTAHLTQIEVLEEFIGDTLEEYVHSSRYEDKRDDLGFRYSFALKTFKKRYESVYNNERDAFNGLRDNDKVVRYLGHFEQEVVRADTNAAQGRRLSGHEIETEAGETENEVIDKERTKYNILLEYGEFDLGDLFGGARSPPSQAKEIMGFYKNLFEVADAVRRVHDVKDQRGEFHGWHADIKPANILSVEGKLKLADPGFAAFLRKDGYSSARPETFIYGGTATYGAPELADRNTRGTLSAVPQTIDIWSLGCVFSMAATWVVQGAEGVRQYAKIREDAIKKCKAEYSQRPLSTMPPPIRNGSPSRVHSSQRLGQPSNDSGSPCTGADYFHAFGRVLPAVTEWHQYLRCTSRRSDLMTGPLLNLVDERMLLSSTEPRISAVDLCNELDKIATKCAACPMAEIPVSIVEVLRKLDEDAPSEVDTSHYPNMGNSQLGDHVDLSTRRERKSRLRDIPLKKTMHRSQRVSPKPGVLHMARSHISLCEIPTELHNPDFTLHVPPLPVDTVLATPTAASREPVDSPRDSSPGGSSTNPSRGERSGVTIPSDNRTGIDPPSTPKATQKTRYLPNVFQRRSRDPELSRHFSDRDIVSSLHSTCT